MFNMDPSLPMRVLGEIKKRNWYGIPVPLAGSGGRGKCIFGTGMVYEFRWGIRGWGAGTSIFRFQKTGSLIPF